jgi:hypothetical protein
MVCCLIAAFLVAQFVAMVRRWGIFWGVVQSREHEDSDTIYRRIKIWFAHPTVRRTAFALAAIELAVLGGWTYTEHGAHLYRIADQAVGKLRGQTILYVGLCSPNSSEMGTRVVIASADRDALFAARQN